jgi:hypothetical protein
MNKFDIPAQTRTIHFGVINEVRRFKLKLPKLRFWSISNKIEINWHCVAINDDEVECYVPLQNIFYDNSICLNDQYHVNIESKEEFLNTFYNTVFSGEAVCCITNYLDFSKTKLSALDFLEIADYWTKENVIFDFFSKWQNDKQLNLIPLGKGLFDK